MSPRWRGAVSRRGACPRMLLRGSDAGTNLDKLDHLRWLYIQACEQRRVRGCRYSPSRPAGRRTSRSLLWRDSFAILLSGPFRMPAGAGEAIPAPPAVLLGHATCSEPETEGRSYRDGSAACPAPQRLDEQPLFRGLVTRPARDERLEAEVV